MAEEVHDGASLRAALAEIASDFSFSWTPGARQLFADLAPAAILRARPQPTALLSELTDEDLSRALTPEYALRLGRVQERLESGGRAGHLVAGNHGSDDMLVAYFSTEFGLDQMLPIVLRGPRHPRGRPPEGGLRARRAARRRRPLLPSRLLPAAARRGRPPGRALSAERPEPAPAHARADGADRSCSRTATGSSSRCGSACGARRSAACRSTSSTRRSKEIPTGRATRPTRSTAATARTACARRSCSASAVCACCASSGSTRPSSTSTKATRHSSSSSGCASSSRTRASAGTRRSSVCAASTVFTTHTPVAGRERGVRRRSRPPEPRAARRALRLHVGGVRRARKGAPRGNAVRSHTLRAQNVGVRERSVRAARTGVARDVARPVARPAGRRGSDHLDHERRPCTDVDLRRARGPARAPVARLRARARARRRRALGCASRREEAHARVHRPHARRRRARSGRADDRVRPSLRDVQARRPPVQPAGAAREAARRSPPADPGARRRQGAPGGRGRQGRHPAGRRLRAQRGRHGPRRLPRGLRDDARAAARPGLRRLAEHAAPADGGLGDVRDEGGAQRRAQLLHPRRLVGRGVHAGARVRDRHRRGGGLGGGAGRTSTPSRSSRFSSSRCCRRSTSATSASCRRGGSR